MQDVLQVVTLDRFFRVEQFEEFLDKLWRHEHFERAHFDGLINDELQEELVDALQVWPRWIHLLILINTGLREAKVRLFDVGQGAEDVLLNHLNHALNVRDNELGHVLLVGKQLLQFLHRVESLSLDFNDIC